MTRISFYILKEEGDTAQLNFACRLTEKAHSEGHNVYLHAVENHCVQLDNLLWTFRQGSFVPHVLADNLDEQTPVVIGSAEPPARFDDMLINLAGEVPAFFSRFARTMEIVTPDTKEAARRRYKFYQDRGYELETHNIA